MADDEQRATIILRAREMARSGRYAGWRTIVTQLRADGLPQVSEMLRDDSLKEELDRHCRATRSDSLLR